MKSGSNAAKANIAAKLITLLLSSNKVSPLWKIVILLAIGLGAYYGGFMDGLLLLLMNRQEAQCLETCSLVLP